MNIAQLGLYKVLWGFQVFGFWFLVLLERNHMTFLAVKNRRTQKGLESGTHVSSEQRKNSEGCLGGFR